MAKKAEVSVLIRAKDLTATVIGRFRRRMRKLTTSIKSVTRSMLAFAVATTAALVGLTKLGQQGDKVLAVQSAFARVTDDDTAALKRLREASRGTVASFKLMALHNQSLALGAAKSTEEFANQIEVVRDLARAQGFSVDVGLEKFTVGMARLSKLRLDDLGIKIDTAKAEERFRVEMGLGTRALTESEKATAFRNEAVRDAIRLVDEFAGKENAGAEAANRFAASMTNLKDAFAVLVAESPEVAKFFDKITGVVDSLVGIISQDAGTFAEAFGALGSMAGSAFGAAFFKALSLSLNALDKLVLPKFLEDRLVSVFGIFGEAAQANVDAMLANMEASAVFLESLSRRPGGGGGGGGPAKVPVVPVAVPGAIGRRSFPGFGPSAAGIAAFNARRARLLRARLSPQGAPRAGDVGLLTGEPGFDTGARLEGTADEVAAAAKAMDSAGQVAAAAMFGTAQAIVAGSQEIAASLTRMITQVLQSLPGVSGFAGVLIGGFGGLASALLSRGNRRIPVSVDDYSNAALAKLKANSGEPIHVTTILNQDGVEIERIERELFDRQNRDETVRIGRDFVGRR